MPGRHKSSLSVESFTVKGSGYFALLLENDERVRWAWNVWGMVFAGENGFVNIGRIQVGLQHFMGVFIEGSLV